MQTAPVISFKNLDPSPVIEEIVEKRIAVLERISDRIIGCEVTLDAPQKHKEHGQVHRAHINLRVPGPDITVEREVAQGNAHDDLVLALNRAFSAAEMQLKRQKKTMAEVEVKHHPPILHGEITLLESELGYGYIRADDGREVYFQKDGLTSDDWDSLKKGTRLRFREMEGEKGAFAAAVTVID